MKKKKVKKKSFSKLSKKQVQEWARRQKALAVMFRQIDFDRAMEELRQFVPTFAAQYFYKTGTDLSANQAIYMASRKLFLKRLKE